MKLRGRVSLALVLSLDSVLFSYLIILILHSSFEQYDMALLALHLTHIFTILLGYVVVHYATRGHEALRLLVLFYLVAFLFDSLTVVGRIVVVSRAEQHLSLPIFLRIIVGTAFVILDLCGAFFADMTRATAYLLAVRTDEQIQAIALEEHRRAQKLSVISNNTQSIEVGT